MISTFCMQTERSGDGSITWSKGYHFRPSPLNSPNKYQSNLSFVVLHDIEDICLFSSVDVIPLYISPTLQASPPKVPTPPVDFAFVSGQAY